MMRFRSRRKANRALALLSVLAALPQLACSQKEAAPMKPPTPLSAEDAALKHKFRGMRGGELRVDSTFETDSVVIINVDSGYLLNVGMGVFVPGGSTVSSYGGNVDGDRLAVPKHLRMMRYPETSRLLSRYKFPYFDGTPIVDVTVPVAERIPEEALDDLRRHGGGLRLKLRITPETLLVGWDIARSDPPIKSLSGTPIFGPTRYSWIGGDFREAIRFNGRVVEKGWYIDPKTGQRIETDF